MGPIQDAVYALTDLGVTVLSPADPRVVDQFGDFLFVASDRVRAIRLVQGRHLAAIAESDLLWLVAPGGYIGQSAAMEIGFAVASRTPVYTTDVPADLTLRQYVTLVDDYASALRHLRSGAITHVKAPNPDILVEPIPAIEAAHRDLELIRNQLDVADIAAGDEGAVLAARRIRRSLSTLD